MKIMIRRSIFHKPLWFLLIAIFSTNTQAFCTVQAPPAREKIASGIYQTDIPQQMVYRESWVLWRTENGKLEAESQISVQIDGKDQPSFKMFLSLTPDLHLTDATLTSMAPGMKKSGKVTFEFLDNEIRATATGPEGNLTSEGNLKISQPYDLFFPYPWFLGSIVARVPRTLGQAVSTKVILIDEGHGPKQLGLIPIESKIEYLGEEKVRIGDTIVTAQKFEIRPDPLPRFFVWTSPEGIVLAYQDSKKSEQRIGLVNFERFEDF